MPRPIELYGANTGNSLRASIALAEAGLDHVVHRVDLQAREHYTAAFRKLNPDGKVPVIVDTFDGAPLILTQSNAIMFHAADRAPETILPARGLARARALERYFAFLTDAIAPSHASFFLRGLDAGAPVQPIEDKVVARLIMAEAHVTGAPFMAGEAFTIADIAAFTILLAYRRQLDWSSLPNLAGWAKRIEARPGVQQGLSAFHSR